MRKFFESKAARVIITTISIITSLCIVALAMLELSETMNTTGILVPLMGLNMLCLAYSQRGRGKFLLYTTLGVGIFIIVASIIVLII